MPVTEEAASWATVHQDRRLYPRKFLSGTGYMVVPGRPAFEVHTLDISMGGMAVVSPFNLAYELPCEVHFTLPREPAGVDILAVPVRVVHSILSGREHGFLVGLQFVNVPAQTAATISRFMAANSLMMGAGG